jgi:DNA invertase Pin-like site-specific DNA recombinase
LYYLTCVNETLRLQIVIKEGRKMQGQHIGYIRVSSAGQNTERQLDGIKLDRTFEDKVSGKNTERPKFQEMMEFVREGDTVVVHSMDRLARNLDDLRRIVQTLTKRGVSVEFMHEHLTFTGEDTPMANLMLSVMGAFAEFERALIRERQLEGIAIAKGKGLYKGRKRVLTTEEVAAAYIRVKNGDKKTQIAKDLDISRQTLYGYLNAANWVLNKT